jgi:hypothetical protein
MIQTPNTIEKAKEKQLATTKNHVHVPSPNPHLSPFDFVLIVPRCKTRFCTHNSRIDLLRRPQLHFSIRTVRHGNDFLKRQLKPEFLPCRIVVAERKGHFRSVESTTIRISLKHIIRFDACPMLDVASSISDFFADRTQLGIYR